MAGSQSEVYDIVRSEGPPAGTSVAEWVAKAGQESSFRSDVVNGIGCVGYWQICPVNFSTVGFTSAQLKNGRNNFKAAKIIYGRQGWRAWQASGGKPSVSDIAEHAGRDVSLTSPGDLLAGAAGLAASLDPTEKIAATLGNVVSTINSAAKWIGDPHNWVRITMVVGGTLVGLAGASMILKETDAGKAIVKGVTK